MPHCLVQDSIFSIHQDSIILSHLVFLFEEPSTAPAHPEILINFSLPFVTDETLHIECV